MPKIECALVTCTHNKRFNEGYGYCESPHNIILKFRLAGDFGKGTIVMVECLKQELPQKGE
jgi:hypothetical protein